MVNAWTHRCYQKSPCFDKPQAYIKKGHIPIQVFPVPNVYTTCMVNSFVLVKFAQAYAFIKYFLVHLPVFLDVLSQNMVYELETGST